MTYPSRSSPYAGSASDSEYLNAQPPPYTQPDSNARYLSKSPAANASGFYEKGATTSRRNPKNWSRKCWIILAVCVIIIVIIVIVVAVVVTRENRYPDYSTLNYSLVDTFSGSSFFDNFDYFTGYDPAAGFVQ